MVLPYSDKISRVPSYSNSFLHVHLYGAITLYGRLSHTVLVMYRNDIGLIRVRSPLLAESHLMSFPPGT